MATTTRISVSLSKSVLAKLDAYCAEMGIARSAALSMFAMQALKGYEGLEAIAKLATETERKKQE